MNTEAEQWTGEDRRQPQRGVRFDKTINLGHLLTFAGFIFTILVGWNTMDKRVVVLEESRKAQELRDSGQDQRNTDQLAAIKESLVEIKQNVIALRDRQDRDRTRP
jgi:hypothetical protein